MEDIRATRGRAAAESIAESTDAVFAVAGRRDRAVGFWVDDPKHPGVSAFVNQGKLASLTIPQSYMGLRREELEAVVNAVIVNAFLDAAPAVRSRSDA